MNDFLAPGKGRHEARPKRPPTRLERWIGNALALGTDGYPNQVQRRLRLVNLMSYLIAFATIAYIVQYAALDWNYYAHLIWINVGILLLMSLVPLLHRLHPALGALWVVAVEFTALFVLTAYLSNDSGLHLQYFIAPAALSIIFGLQHTWLIGLLVALSLALHIAAHFLFPAGASVLTADVKLLDTIYINAAVTTSLLVAAGVFYAFRLAARAEAQLDELLHTVLPAPIVEKLRENPDGQIAETFDNASILFADLVGFAPLALKLGAQRVVALLNKIVTRLDFETARLGVEKIKTIGDCYMAMSDVLQRRSDHAERLGTFALALVQIVQEVAEEEQLDLNVRIGIAAGPVIAGLIGVRKFTFDVWGETVNLAARLESHGRPGRIQVNTAFKELTQHMFEFSPGGMVVLKGVGETETWFLERPR